MLLAHVVGGGWLAALVAHLGLKPKANSSSPLKRTKILDKLALKPVKTGFGC
jgi:hypothetical protein